MTESYLETASEKDNLCAEPSNAPSRLRSIYRALLATYGPQQWWPAKTPFEVVVGAYLTQNTSWRGVELSIENLRAQDALTVQGIRSLPEESLRALIRPSGYMVRKAAAVKFFVAMLDAEYAGSLEALAAEPALKARARLLQLPGVGEETADAILLYALGHPVFVVDEYFRRVATRHGLIAGILPRRRILYASMQQLAHEAFAGDDSQARHYNEFHALIVEVGKRHCGPTPRCEGCPLAADLSASRAHHH